MPLHILDPCSVKLDFPDGIEKVHCGSCNLDVIDFTNFTEQDLKVYFSTKSVGRVCGRIIKQPEVNYKVEIIQVLQKVQQTKLFSFRFLFIICFALISCAENKKEKVENQMDTAISLTEDKKVDGVVEKINKDIIQLDSQNYSAKNKKSDTKKSKVKVNESGNSVVEMGEIEYNPNDSVVVFEATHCSFLDEFPVFPDGDAGFIDYIKRNLINPDTNYLPKVRSVVYIDFVINTLGKVVDVKVKRGINKQCDEAAMNVIRSSPDFKPAIQNGRPVNYQYTIPIKFNPPNSK